MTEQQQNALNEFCRVFKVDEDTLKTVVDAAYNCYIGVAHNLTSNPRTSRKLARDITNLRKAMGVVD